MARNITCSFVRVNDGHLTCLNALKIKEIHVETSSSDPGRVSTRFVLAYLASKCKQSVIAVYE